MSVGHLVAFVATTCESHLAESSEKEVWPWTLRAVVADLGVALAALA